MPGSARIENGQGIARIRLACVEFRGCLSAAMLYDRQPIVDHFRRIDANRLLGLMQARDAPPYFFLLTNVEETSSAERP